VHMLLLPATVTLVSAGVPRCCDACVPQGQQGRRVAAGSGGAVAVLGVCHDTMQHAHVYTLCSCMSDLTPVASSSKQRREPVEMPVACTPLCFLDASGQDT
jgi:hypothetical protein